MSQSQDIFIQGKGKWIRHDKPDAKFSPARWSHVQYPNAAGLEIIREMQAKGLKNQLKKDDDGYYIKWSRKTFIKGRFGDVPLEPPKLFIKDENGNPIPYNGGPLGNGTDLTTKLKFRTYKTPSGGNGAAARWESSMIDNLVPYEGGRDFTDDEAKSFKGLDEQPAQW